MNPNWRDYLMGEFPLESVDPTREAFETYARGRNCWLQRHKQRPDEYFNIETQNMWEGWRAAVDCMRTHRPVPPATPVADSPGYADLREPRRRSRFDWDRYDRDVMGDSGPALNCRLGMDDGPY